MKIKKWLKKNDLSLRRFSKEIDYSFTHLSLVFNGKLKMGPKLAKAIEKHTGGLFKAKDLMRENAIEFEKFREEQEKNQQEKIE